MTSGRLGCWWSGVLVVWGAGGLGWWVVLVRCCASLRYGSGTHRAGADAQPPIILVVPFPTEWVHGPRGFHGTAASVWLHDSNGGSCGHGCGSGGHGGGDAGNAHSGGRGGGVGKAQRGDGCCSGGHGGGDVGIAHSGGRGGGVGKAQHCSVYRRRDHGRRRRGHGCRRRGHGGGRRDGCR